MIHRSRSRLGLFLGFSIFTVTLPASAEPRAAAVGPVRTDSASPGGAEAISPTRTNGGLEVWLSLGEGSAWLRDSVFRGRGRPLSLGVAPTFEATGRQLGFATSSFFETEFGLSYVRRYVTAGAFFVGGGGLSRDEAPTNRDLAASVSAASAWSYGGGVQLFGGLPIGPATLRLGARAGLRDFELPIGVFESTICRIKGQSYACPETAKTVSAFIEPRVSYEVEATKYLSVGAWAAFDVWHDGGLSWGIMFSLRTTPFSLLAP
jgi:hypothetical protein